MRIRPITNNAKTILFPRIKSISCRKYPYARTAELCLEAVRKNAFALDYVPEKLRDYVRRKMESSE